MASIRNYQFTATGYRETDKGWIQSERYKTTYPGIVRANNPVLYSGAPHLGMASSNHTFELWRDGATLKGQLSLDLYAGYPLTYACPSTAQGVETAFVATLASLSGIELAQRVNDDRWTGEPLSDVHAPIPAEWPNLGTRVSLDLAEVQAVIGFNPATRLQNLVNNAAIVLKPGPEGLYTYELDGTQGANLISKFYGILYPIGSANPGAFTTLASSLTA